MEGGVGFGAVGSSVGGVRAVAGRRLCLVCWAGVLVFVLAGVLAVGVSPAPAHDEPATAVCPGGYTLTAGECVTTTTSSWPASVRTTTTAAARVCLTGQYNPQFQTCVTVTTSTTAAAHSCPSGYTAVMLGGGVDTCQQFFAPTLCPAGYVLTGGYSWVYCYNSGTGHSVGVIKTCPGGYSTGSSHATTAASATPTGCTRARRVPCRARSA